MGRRCGRGQVGVAAGPRASTGHLHGVIDLAQPLTALRVGAGLRAAAIHRAGAGERRGTGAREAGHAGRGHCGQRRERA